MITDLRALISNAFQVCVLLGVAWMICMAFVIFDATAGQ